MALSLPGTSALGLVLLWIPLVCEEAWFWRRAGDCRKTAAREENGKRKKQSEFGAPIASWSTPFLRPAGDFPEVSAQPPASEVIQQLVRSRMADGSEILAGRLRVPLAAGQRTASVHVAFCPPFARAPEAKIEQIDGPEARIKTAQNLPFGARFDVKLVEPSEEEGSVLLEFRAQTGGEPRP
jgi:hypothetical protein